MKKWAKYLIVAGLLVLAIGAGWWLRGPPKGAKEVLEFFASLAPKPSTSSDWAALAVERGKATISGKEMPVVPEGNYAVNSVKGDPYEDEIFINGTGGVGIVNRHAWLNSEYMLDSNRSRAGGY